MKTTQRKPKTKIGDKFERLIVKSDGVVKNGTKYVICECVCGDIKEYILNNLRRGNTTSCGCLQKEKAIEARSLEKSDVKPFSDGVYEISLFGKFKDVGKCLISEEDVGLVTGRRWSVLRKKRKDKPSPFYVYTCINRKIVYLHTFLMNSVKGCQVDHRNGKTFDNRRSNLRIVTGHQNTMNNGGSPKASSKYIGVSWDKINEMWVAQVHYNGKCYKKRFKEEVEAAKVRDEVAKNFFGEYARLNFPPPSHHEL